MIDLVTGYAYGYSAEQVRPFLKSLRLTGYEGRILLFANGDAAIEAKKWNVDLRPCPKPVYRICSDRFIRIAEALKDIPCEGILLSDTRDVVFQKNPATFLPSSGLNVYEEDHNMRIGTCNYNSKWILTGYGREVLKKLENAFISCAGVSCGDEKSMKIYLDRLCEEIRRIQPKSNLSLDQAAHNFLIRVELESKIWNNDNGEVYTVGYVKRNTVKIKGNKIINDNGEVPAVVHQWDRHNKLCNLIKCTL